MIEAGADEGRLGLVGVEVDLGGHARAGQPGRHVAVEVFRLGHRVPGENPEGVGQHLDGIGQQPLQVAHEQPFHLVLGCFAALDDVDLVNGPHEQIPACRVVGMQQQVAARHQVHLQPQADAGTALRGGEGPVGGHPAAARIVVPDGVGQPAVALPVVGPGDLTGKVEVKGMLRQAERLQTKLFREQAVGAG